VIPFKTTPDQILKLAAIVVEMDKMGLEKTFIVGADELARSDQGVYDLMALWMGSSDTIERDEIIADIQDSLDDYADAPAEPVKKPYIKYDKLDEVVQKILADKTRLRDLIDRHGGVSAVARKSGIPQPSLSRMLSSASMPRRTSLYKIANALDLPESEIVTEWSR
jgi:DNA-binding phage protein